MDRSDELDSLSKCKHDDRDKSPINDVPEGFLLLPQHPRQFLQRFIAGPGSLPGETAVCKASPVPFADSSGTLREPLSPAHQGASSHEISAIDGCPGAAALVAIKDPVQALFKKPVLLLKRLLCQKERDKRTCLMGLSISYDYSN